MAGRLLAAGYPLVVHDARASAAASPSGRAGRAGPHTPAEVARRRETVITIVPTSREVRQVLRRAEGSLLDSAAAAASCIEMTTGRSVGHA